MHLIYLYQIITTNSSKIGWRKDCFGKDNVLRLILISTDKYSYDIVGSYNCKSNETGYIMFFIEYNEQYYKRVG